jgi:hypothetical protein
MTRMSDSRSIPPAAPICNLLQSQGRSPLARPVQAGRSALAIEALLLMMLCATLVGCVFPPQLQPEEDAGTDSPPAITSVSGDQTAAFIEPGPVVLAQGATGSSLLITLLDTDVNDTLYVRLFVDYNAPDKLPPRVICGAAPTGKPMRTATCNVSGLCMSADVGVQRNLTIVVSDRKPADFGDDPQKIDLSGASTDRFYFLKCQPPQTP